MGCECDVDRAERDRPWVVVASGWGTEGGRGCGGVMGARAVWRARPHGL